MLPFQALKPRFSPIFPFSSLGVSILGSNLLLIFAVRSSITISTAVHKFRQLQRGCRHIHLLQWCRFLILSHCRLVFHKWAINLKQKSYFQCFRCEELGNNCVCVCFFSLFLNEFREITETVRECSTWIKRGNSNRRNNSFNSNRDRCRRQVHQHRRVNRHSRLNHFPHRRRQRPANSRPFLIQMPPIPQLSIVSSELLRRRPRRPSYQVI